MSDTDNRCTFDHRGQGPRCSREVHGDDVPHLFKCCSPSCPGLIWPASVMAHPYNCGNAGGSLGQRGADLVETPDAGLQ